MLFVNDVTRINKIPVMGIARPTSTDELRSIVAGSTLPLSVGGGHFSMGGQTASPQSLHIDMRDMNHILEFCPVEKRIRVEAGTRWCDIQKHVDRLGLAVKIMQTYANFTVGGALSVNAHGRYVGLGPVVLSVREIMLVMADGAIINAAPTQNAELFYAAVGGYGALGIIAEAELELVENDRVARTSQTMQTMDYLSWFASRVRDDKSAVFHNADLYPPSYRRARAVTWRKTDKPATSSLRLQPLRKIYALEKYFLWAISETPMGKFRRERLIDPLLYLSKKVHWRNYEAGYDVAELEPFGRDARTYVLQEYFVPCDRIMDFVPKMGTILRRYNANIINISVRHAISDPGTLLAWARGETFAFVVYFKQRTSACAIEHVGAWTRDLIDAALDCGGTYYLPYQLHATSHQFHQAYPRASELFALKKLLDPTYRLRGALWDRYYMPTLQTIPSSTSLFHAVYRNPDAAVAFYDFLRHVFHLYPEARFQALIKDACARYQDDRAIYETLQAELPGIAPLFGKLRLALPALLKQKSVIGDQSAGALERKAYRDYVEIGSSGMYVKPLRKRLDITGTVTLIDQKAPTNSPADILVRGQIGSAGKFIPLDSYAPLNLPAGSADLVGCFVGLHHIPLDKLDAFIASIAATVRPGGYFLLREHDVASDAMDDMVSLAHCVFNAGTGESWHNNTEELRFFRPVDEWVPMIESHGFKLGHAPIAQDGDPTANLLLAFVRQDH